MRGIKLTERINYLQMQDDEGELGVMTLKGKGDVPPKVATIESEADFRFWFNKFTTIETAGL